MSIVEFHAVVGKLLVVLNLVLYLFLVLEIFRNSSSNGSNYSSNNSSIGNMYIYIICIYYCKYIISQFSSLCLLYNTCIYLPAMYQCWTDINFIFGSRHVIMEIDKTERFRCPVIRPGGVVILCHHVCLF